MRPSWTSLMGGCLGDGGGSVTAGKARRLADSVGQQPVFTHQDLPAGSDPDCLHVFTFAELSSATGGFSSRDNFIGEGMYGPVYKGFVDGVNPPAQAVAVRRIDRRHAALRREEAIEEAMFVGKLRHPNLVKTIGYCREEAEQLAVYEYMAHGSLDDHLFTHTHYDLLPLDVGVNPSVLPWSTRLNIAIGVAKGLAFLHDASDKPFVHGDLKASNILLDKDYSAKLSYKRLPKDYVVIVRGCRGGVVMGFAAAVRCRSPEYYSIAGDLTVKNDVYDFGVVLLEVLAGRRSVDSACPAEERDLVEFARTSMVARIMDPALEGRYPAVSAEKMVVIAYKCLNVKPKKRPDMAAIVQTLEPLLLDGVTAVGGGDEGGVEDEGRTPTVA